MPPRAVSREFVYPFINSEQRKEGLLTSNHWLRQGTAVQPGVLYRHAWTHRVSGGGSAALCSAAVGGERTRRGSESTNTGVRLDGPDVPGGEQPQPRVPPCDLVPPRCPPHLPPSPSAALGFAEGTRRPDPPATPSLTGDGAGREGKGLGGARGTEAAVPWGTRRSSPRATRPCRSRLTPTRLSSPWPSGPAPSSACRSAASTATSRAAFPITAAALRAGRTASATTSASTPASSACPAAPAPRTAAANGLWIPLSRTRSRGAIAAAAAARSNLRRRSPAVRALPAPLCPAAAAAPSRPPGARPAAPVPDKRCSPGARPASRAANEGRPPGARPVARPAARSPRKRCPPGSRGRTQRCPPVARLRPRCSPPGRCPASPLLLSSARPSRAPTALWLPAGPRCCLEASRFRPAHFRGDATCRGPTRQKIGLEDPCWLSRAPLRCSG